MEDPVETQMRREARRQEIVRDAVSAADRILMARSDGSNEELNFLTGQVARIFLEKACLPHVSALSRADLFRRS